MQLDHCLFSVVSLSNIMRQNVDIIYYLLFMVKYHAKVFLKRETLNFFIFFAV